MFWFRKSKKKAAEIQALGEFVEGNVSEKSGGQIKLGLVEIVEDGFHSSNGLLVTENGYFLTPKHCTRNLAQKSIRLHGGNEYDIEKICATAKKEDIALVKASIPKECRPMIYSFEKNLVEKEIVALYFRWDGIVGNSYGFVYSLNNRAETKLRSGKIKHYKNQFVLNIEGKPGYSGSLAINSNRGIIGLLSGGCKEDIPYVAMCVRISEALRLVDFYRQKLESK